MHRSDGVTYTADVGALVQDHGWSRSIFNTTVANTTAAMILLNLRWANDRAVGHRPAGHRELSGGVQHAGRRTLVDRIGHPFCGRSGAQLAGGTLNHYSSGTSPAFILVEDITPVKGVRSSHGRADR